MSIRSYRLMMLLNSSMSLMTFCLVILSVTEKGILKSPTIIADLSISPLNSISFYFIYFEPVVWCIHI